jgi:hypothetical protein
MVFLIAGIANSAHAYSKDVNVYQIGSNVQGLAKDHTTGDYTDIGTTFEGGVPVISWTFEDVPINGWATLTIKAEGIDQGEADKVFFNDTFIGYLTQQTTGTPSYLLQPNRGVYNGFTEQTTSIFTVWAKKDFVNTVRIEVAVGNWVNEIETSNLTTVPEPTPLLLFGTGLAGLAAFGRRKRS